MFGILSILKNLMIEFQSNKLKIYNTYIKSIKVLLKCFIKQPEYLNKVRHILDCYSEVSNKIYSRRKCMDLW